MKLELIRRHKGKDYTIGTLYVDGVRLCDTLEDTDRGLDKSMPLATIKARKVYGSTAIPTGLYTMGFTYSPKFASRSWAKSCNGMVPLVMGVPGFDGVRIHPGNTAADTLGCILPGENKIKGQVINSTAWYAKFLAKFVPAWKRGEKITIEIE